MIDPKNLNIESLPSVGIESRNLLPPRPSVYFAVDTQSRIQYIGRSLNTKTRWAKHSKLKDLLPLGDIKICYLLLPENVLLFVENVLIEYFQPPLNFAKQDSSKIKIKELTPQQVTRQDVNRDSYDRYTRFALEYASNNFVAPKRHLKIAEQQAIAIHSLLSDGKWHTAQEIGELLDVSKRTTHNIMRSLITPFAITSGQQGYTIPNKNTILIA